jgi:hypothetical protein
MRIVRGWLGGLSIRELARRTGHDRKTISRIIRAPEVQTDLQGLKEKLLGHSEAWVESLNYRIDNEMDGEMAFRLLERFDVIPSPKVQVNVPGAKKNRTQ